MFVKHITIKVIFDHVATFPEELKHRRRMETEAKAKVVPFVWGTKLPSLAALTVLPRSIWKKRLN